MNWRVVGASSAVLFLLVAASACWAGRGGQIPGTQAIDFPIQVVQVQLGAAGGYASYVAEQIQVQTKDGWVPLRTGPGTKFDKEKDFLDMLKAALVEDGVPGVQALQAVANSEVPTETLVKNGVPSLDNPGQRCYIVDRGNHPIWLRARAKRVELDPAHIRSMGDEWYAGSGSLGDWKFQTYFVTMVTMYKPVQTVHGQRTQVIKTKHQFIKEWRAH